MPEEVILDVTTIEENVTVETTAGDVVEIQVVAPTGTAATVAVGATTTGAAGTNASVTNSGTTSAAVFNFTIPRGDTGATGATGATGPNSVTSATTSDGTADLDVDTITGDGSGLTGLVSAQITDASMGATDESVVNVLAKFGPYGELSATQFQAPAISVIPNGIINLASTNVGGVVTLSGELATDVRSIAFPNASGTIALTSSATGTIASDDITDFTAAVEAIAPDAVTSETTSDGTASLDISNLTLSQDVTSGLQTAMTLSGNPTTVGDGQQIIWQWYNGGSPVTTAVIATEVTSSNSDKLIFKTSESGSLATSLDLNNSLATFSGVVSSLGATYQTGSTFTYNGSTAAAHRTALGVSASGDTVLKSAYTPAHSLLVQQSGTGSPSSLSVGNNTILGRASGGGSAIAALSGSDARTVLGLSTLATTTPAANVATFLATPTSANLAAAVTGETGSGALVFGTSPTIDAPTISGSAAFTSTTRPTSAGTGTPSATSLITRDDGDARYLELLSPKIIVTTPSDLAKASSGISSSSAVSRGLLSLRTGTSGVGAAAGIALTNDVANTGTMSTAVGSGLSLLFPQIGADGAHIGLFYGGHPASLPVLLADFDNSGANGFSLQFRRNGAQFEARLTWRINGTASVSAWESLGVGTASSRYRGFVFVTSTGIKGAIYRGGTFTTYDTIDYSTPVWSRTENFTFTGNLGNWNGVTYAHSGDSTILVSRFETLNRFSI